MARTVYSARLVAGDVAPDEPLTWTCPEGYVAVVLCMDGVAYVGTGTDNALNCQLNGVSFYFALPSGDDDSFGVIQYRGRQTLYPGDTLTFVSGTYVAVTANGYLLAGASAPAL